MATRPKPASLLRLAPDVEVRVTDDRATLVGRGRPVSLRTRQLPLIFSFHRPRRLEDALAASTSPQDWIADSATLVELHDSGILLSDEDRPVALAATGRGFASAGAHIAMLDDEVRTRSFVGAVREVVQPGDVVVDLGTGTGVLAIAAAQAGARRVFAIERTPIADVAERMFAANGVADRVELLRGTSTDIVLPERADVLVSEVIGSEPMDEDVLAYTRDAVKRFLKPTARLIPEALELSAAPVQLPDEVSRRHIFHAETCTAWDERYGMSFAPLADLRARAPFPLFLTMAEAKRCIAAGPACSLARVEMRAPPSRLEASATLTSADHWDAVLITTLLTLSPTRVVPIDPLQEATATHWAAPLWVLPRSVSGTAEVTYRYTGVRSYLEVHHE